MADNSLITTASGDEEFANKDIAGVKHPKHILVNTSGTELNAATSEKQDVANTALAAIEAAVEGTLTVAPHEVSIAESSLADPFAKYEQCPASTTTTLSVSGAGALGDYLAYIEVTPTSLSPGAISIQDGANTAIEVFVGGTDSLLSLKPFPIHWGGYSTNGAWKVIMGSGAKGVAFGSF